MKDETPIFALPKTDYATFQNFLKANLIDGISSPTSTTAPSQVVNTTNKNNILNRSVDTLSKVGGLIKSSSTSFDQLGKDYKPMPSASLPPMVPRFNNFGNATRVSFQHPYVAALNAKSKKANGTSSAAGSRNVSPSSSPGVSTKDMPLKSGTTNSPTSSMTTLPGLAGQMKSLTTDGSIKWDAYVDYVKGRKMQESLQFLVDLNRFEILFSNLTNWDPEAPSSGQQPADPMAPITVSSTKDSTTSDDGGAAQQLEALRALTKEADRKKIKDHAWELVRAYFQDQAPLELNIPQAMRDEVLGAINGNEMEVGPWVFFKTKGEMLSGLYLNSWKPFVQAETASIRTSGSLD